MEIISRKEAYEKNKARYFTGKVCKNGHISERYVTSGSCSECLKMFTKAFRSGQKEHKIKYVYLPYISESDLTALKELSQALLEVSTPPPLDMEATHRQIYGEEVARQLRGKA